MDLTAGEEGTEWRYGTPILHLLLERFHRCFLLLQETGRAGHGAMPRRGALHRSGCRIQFHRHHRETYGGKKTLSLDPFFNQRWREARPQTRHPNLKTAPSPPPTTGNVGARVETPV